MADVPALPESDDPFEILGLAYGASPEDVRRAYVRLIRIHRPDRSPEAFQRVREAYEQAKFQAEMQASMGWSGSDEDGDDDEGGPGASAADHERYDRAVADAWLALAEDDEARASGALYDAWKAAPARVRPVVHRLLMADALEVPVSTRVESLIESWQAGAPLANWVIPLLTPAERRAVLLHEAFSWTRLRASPDRDAAEGLVRLRFQTLLREDRNAQVEAEVLDETFVEDGFDRPYLGHVANEVLCALAWRSPAAAVRIRKAFPDDDVQSSYGWDLPDHTEAAQRLGASWRKARVASRHMMPLQRYYELWPVLDDEGVAETAGELLEDFHARPLEYRGAFSSMHRVDRRLLERYVNSIQHLVGTDERAFDARRKRSVQRVMKQADEIIKEHSFYQNFSAVVGLSLLGAIASCFFIGWWGLAVLVGIAALGFWGMHILEGRLYRDVIRKPLMKIAVQEGLSVKALVDWIDSNRKTLGELRSFTPFLEKDPTFSAMHWTMRLEDLVEDPDAEGHR